MTHQRTAYIPQLDEFVLLRQALGAEFTVCQVTALNHADCKAQVTYLIPGRQITKWVMFKQLAPMLDVPGAVSHD